MLAALRRPAIGSGVPPLGDRFSDPLTNVALPMPTSRFASNPQNALGACGSEKPSAVEDMPDAIGERRNLESQGVSTVQVVKN